MNRFDLVEDGVVHLECGPNTIRTFEERNLQFSAPFFVTGTQLLVRKENLSNVNLNGSLRGVTIGALRRTTNKRLIRDRYPDATIKNFVGVTGRMRGLQALQDGRIDAFASDGILLVGEAVLLGLVLERDYVLIPPNPLQCDYYGLILPNNDPNWKALIDRAIKQAAQEGVFQQWLGVILPELEQSLEYCRQLPNSEEEDLEDESDPESESFIEEALRLGNPLSQ
jgi:polar amino acid transport system substrate-binding protein